MSTPTVYVHLLTYSGDSALVLENLLCTRQALPQAHLVVLDDGNDPCPEEVRAQAESLGAEWRVTSWSRGGNLRGRPCIEGILTELLASSRHEKDVLIKIDADTCLLDSRPLLRFAASDQVLWGTGRPNIRIFGCLYALRPEAARRALEYIGTLDLDDHAPEDIIVGMSLTRLYPEPGLLNVTPPLSASEWQGIWCAYAWRHYPDVTPLYDRFAVVTTGNKVPPPLDRSHRLTIMTSLRKAAGKYHAERISRERAEAADTQSADEE